jgi:tRNA pseudouridine38-40 synthase
LIIFAFMTRYFLELSYKGARYSGFQVQQNALTVQSEVEKALEIFFRQKIVLTGSSRTDAGVHALQNYFHFDFEGEIRPASLYNINAILPPDIVLRSVYPAMYNGQPAHARFHAISREYRYYIYKSKDPFLEDRAYFYPYSLDVELLNQAAAVVMKHTDFTSFSKRNTPVKTFRCQVMISEWESVQECLVYHVKANRFLRGMVRGLVGTMLQVGRGKISVDDFSGIIEKRDCTLADFSVPAHGLFLTAVEYPADLMQL